MQPTLLFVSQRNDCLSPGKRPVSFFSKSAHCAIKPLTTYQRLVISFNTVIEQACTGAEVEMVTSGGELAFVSIMIEQSLSLRGRVRWYTSMLGKLSSVSALVEKLIGLGNHNYAVTEFIQGAKTRRWAVAWSWEDWRPSMVSKGLIHHLSLTEEFLFAYTYLKLPELTKKIDKARCPRHYWIPKASTSISV